MACARVYCNVRRKSIAKRCRTYYNYGSIEDELEGKVPQRPGTRRAITEPIRIRQDWPLVS